MGKYTQLQRGVEKNAIMIKTNKQKNQFIGTFASNELSVSHLYKNIALPVWAKKNLNVTKYLLPLLTIQIVIFFFFFKEIFFKNIFF